MTSDWKAVAIAATVGIAMPAAAQQAAAPAGFTSLFDGRTLKGWHGDPTVWSVENGAIAAKAPTALSNNTFLILDRPYADFEIRFKYRFVSKLGNSGLQFRSGQVEGNHVLAGMQANVIPPNFASCGLPSCGQERFGMLYEELGRLEMVLLGQKAVITRRQAKNGGQGAIVRNVVGTVNTRDAIIAAARPYPEWNEEVVIAHGNHIVHALNGVLVFDATDDDPLGMKGGLLGLQAHAGIAPMEVEFKDLYIKPLTAFPNVAGRFRTSPGTAPDAGRLQLNIGMSAPKP